MHSYRTSLMRGARVLLASLGICLGLATVAGAGEISGRVTGADGVPLYGIGVGAYRYEYYDTWVGQQILGWNMGGLDFTDANGDYTIDGLSPGVYRVMFSIDTFGVYAREVYENALDLDAGRDIVIDSQHPNITGINASLYKSSYITGRVTGPNGTNPVEGVIVGAYRQSGSGEWVWEHNVDTDSDGYYVIGGLPAGTYRVEFYPYDGTHAGEYYNDKPDLESAADVVVPSAATINNINVSLGYLWSAGCQNIGGGWRRLGWFGDYVPMGYEGWIWHNRHGFLFIPPNTTQDNIWLYAQDMGWLWTSSTTYPFLYRQHVGAWLWYNGSTNPRWFVNMATGRWERW